MSADAPSFARKKQLALTTLIGASLVLGIVDAALDLDSSNPIVPLFSLALIAIGFRWLQLDSAELDIRRPIWLNIGIVLLAIAFVPYYLYKTRPPERRLPAVLAFFGVLFACVFTSAIGATLMLMISGRAPAPPG